MTEQEFREALSKHGKETLIEMLIDQWKSVNKIIDGFKS